MTAPVAYRTGGASARLLARLVAADGRVVPHHVLLSAMYGADDGPEDGVGTLRVLVLKLRRRLPDGVLTTVPGIGYRLCPAYAATLPQVDDRILVPAEPTGLECRGG